jgi:hypothetical protein
MAAELPVVSTPVPDVKGLHADVIDIAATHREFIDCCERALSLSDAERRIRIRRIREKLSCTSWDSTVTAMHRLLCGLQASSSELASQPSA